MALLGKILLVIAFAAAGLNVLVACSNDEHTSTPISQVQPAPKGPTTVPDPVDNEIIDSYVSYGRIKLPDGRVVDCLSMGGYTAMSCDWANARKEK